MPLAQDSGEIDGCLLKVELARDAALDERGVEMQVDNL